MRRSGRGNQRGGGAISGHEGDREKESDIFVHVGMSKSASTFLQRDFFPRLKGISFHPKQNALGSRITRFIDGSLIESIRDNQKRRIEEKELILDELHSSHRSKILFSDEYYCGRPNYRFIDHFRKTEAIQYLFPKAKIIFIIRKQDSYFESHYKHAVHNGYDGSIYNYLNWQRRGFDGEYRGPGEKMYDTNAHFESDFLCLNYLSMLKNYHYVFGKPNVLCLPYEMMRSDSDRFLQRIARFLGTSTPAAEHPRGVRNRGLSVSGFYLYRWVNHMKRRFLGDQALQGIGNAVIQRSRWLRMAERMLDALYFTPARPASPALKKEIQSQYAEQNWELEALTGVDLKVFGYY